MKILIVEDSPIVTLLHKELLQRSGIAQNPIICYNGKHALDYIKSNYDENNQFLVLLDILMPVIDGWSFIKMCEKENLDKVKIAIVTSCSLKNHEFQINDHKNIIGMYNKPLSIERLEEIKFLGNIVNKK